MLMSVSLLLCCVLALGVALPFETPPTNGTIPELTVTMEDLTIVLTVPILSTIVAGVLLIMSHLESTLRTIFLRIFTL